MSLDPDRPVGHVVHLVRRFFTSLSSRPPSAADVAWARSWLTDDEWAMWRRQDVRDQRHTLQVARSYVSVRPGAPRDEIAGALLHDIGKLAGNLSTFSRVAARVVGPRTARFREYHQHEPIGADMAAAAGSSPMTVAMVRGRSDDADEKRAIRALRDADNAT